MICRTVAALEDNMFSITYFVARNQDIDLNRIGAQAFAANTMITDQ